MGMQSGVFFSGKVFGGLLRQVVFILSVRLYKPDKGIFYHMLEDSGMVPSETLFVDDGDSNVRIGKELGMHTFKPKNGVDWREELSRLLSGL